MANDETFLASIDAFHEEARAQTGLDDFGETSYREGLEVLARSLDEDDQLSPLGRAIHRGEIVKILVARLRTERRLADAPEVLQNQIRRPIVITGLVRTGSTALHYLMGQDPGLQKLEYWICAAPQPRPPRETWGGHPDFEASVKELDFLYNSTPDLMAVHEMKADWPEECRHILAQSFTDDSLRDLNATVPIVREAWYHGTPHTSRRTRRHEATRPARRLHRDRRAGAGCSSTRSTSVSSTCCSTVYPDACVDPSRTATRATVIAVVHEHGQRRYRAAARKRRSTCADIARDADSRAGRGAVKAGMRYRNAQTMRLLAVLRSALPPTTSPTRWARVKRHLRPLRPASCPTEGEAASERVARCRTRSTSTVSTEYSDKDDIGADRNADPRPRLAPYMEFFGLRTLRHRPKE